MLRLIKLSSCNATITLNKLTTSKKTTTAAIFNNNLLVSSSTSTSKFITSPTLQQSSSTQPKQQQVYNFSNSHRKTPSSKQQLILHTPNEIENMHERHEKLSEQHQQTGKKKNSHNSREWKPYYEEEEFSSSSTTTPLLHRIKVSLVGLPNCGKSSLFNCMAGEHLAIVDKKYGMTRDRREYTILDNLVTIIDTPGVEIEQLLEKQQSRGCGAANSKTKTPQPQQQQQLKHDIFKQTMKAIEESHVILLIIDTKKQMIGEDEIMLAKYLKVFSELEWRRKKEEEKEEGEEGNEKNTPLSSKHHSCKIIIVGNKCDGGDWEENFFINEVYSKLLPIFGGEEKIKKNKKQNVDNVGVDNNINEDNDNNEEEEPINQNDTTPTSTTSTTTTTSTPTSTTSTTPIFFCSSEEGSGIFELLEYINNNHIPNELLEFHSKRKLERKAKFEQLIKRMKEEIREINSKIDKENEGKKEKESVMYNRKRGSNSVGSNSVGNNDNNMFNKENENEEEEEMNTMNKENSEEENFSTTKTTKTNRNNDDNDSIKNDGENINNNSNDSNNQEEQQQENFFTNPNPNHNPNPKLNLKPRIRIKEWENDFRKLNPNPENNEDLDYYNMDGIFIGEENVGNVGASTSEGSETGSTAQSSQSSFSSTFTRPEQVFTTNHRGTSTANLRMHHAIKICFIGKPNVGKSSLINELLHEEKMTVSDIPHTTRDSLTTKLLYKGRKVELVDTAGLDTPRLKENLLAKGGRGSKEDRESTEYIYKSQISTMLHVQSSHVTCYVMDAFNAFTVDDFALIRRVIDQGRPIVIVINKWEAIKDKYKKKAERYLAHQIEKNLGELHGNPLVFISVKLLDGLDLMMDKIILSYDKWNRRISTGLLNNWLEKFKKLDNLPKDRDTTLKINYIIQAKVRPPHFILFVNNKAVFKDNYMRFLMRNLTNEFGLDGIPIRHTLRSTNNKENEIKLNPKKAYKKKEPTKDKKRMEELKKKYGDFMI